MNKTIPNMNWKHDTTEHLLPFQLFITNLYHYNYLLNAEKINRIEDIDNLEFQSFISNFPILFNSFNYCNLYKNYLPIDYHENVENKGFISKNNEHKLFKYQYKYLDMKSYNTTTTMTKYINTTSAQTIILENIYPEFVYPFKKLIDNLSIYIVTDFNDLNNIDHLPNEFIDKPQLTYGNFINYQNDKQINGCSERKRNFKASDTLNNSMLYWIDLYKIHFKHNIIINKGEIEFNELTGQSNDYSVCGNAMQVKEYLDQHHQYTFFTDKMRTTYKNTNNPTICPLNVFILNGLLYSHDHRRIAASILGGARYLLGTIHQDNTIIYKRSIGYHINKCISSKSDESLILLFTKPELERFGHYFFIFGNSDQTVLMNTISTKTFGFRSNLLERQFKLYKLLYSINNQLSTKPYETQIDILINDILNEYDPEIENRELFETLHYICNPTFFKSFDLETLRTSYINALELKLNKTNTIEKYFKYKQKYLILKYNNQYGGISIEELDTKIKKKLENNSRLDFVQKLFELQHTASYSIDKTFNYHTFKDNKTNYPLLFQIFNNKKINLMSLIFFDPLNKKHVDEELLLIEIQKLFNQDHLTVSKNLNPLNTSNKLDTSNKSDPLLFLEAQKIRHQVYLLTLKKSYELITQTDQIEDLLLWEIQNICPFIGEFNQTNINKLPTIEYLLNDPTIHNIIKIILQYSYKKIFNVPQRKDRFSKSNNPVLEDIILLLRTGPEFSLPTLGNRNQMYTLEELQNWQRTYSKTYMKTFKFLNQSHLKKVYPQYTTDGSLTHELLDYLISIQTLDHLRFFKNNLNMYGAYQGLIELIQYTELKEYNFKEHGKYAIHLTKIDIAEQILNGTSTYGPSLVLLGRYIHALGYINFLKEYPVLDSHFWNFKLRLYSRFATRVGIAIDMKELYYFYNKLNIPWNEVCGINQLGTIIFLKKIPPHVLISHQRKLTFNENKTQIYNYELYDQIILQWVINNPGIPYTISSIFELNNYPSIIKQFDAENLLFTHNLK